MKFIFPQNYNFQTKLFGFIEYSTAIFNIIYWIILYTILNIFITNLTLKLSIFIILALPIFILSITGIYKENFLNILYYIFKYFLNCNVYVFSKNDYN